MDMHQPVNVWEPADESVDMGYHGEFDQRSIQHSPQLRASLHHRGLGIALGAMTATAAVAATRMRRRVTR